VERALPLALPTMAIGFNQAIMFVFRSSSQPSSEPRTFGQELQRTLAGTDLGKNFRLGICISHGLDLRSNDHEMAADKRVRLGCHKVVRLISPFKCAGILTQFLNGDDAN
jgi:glycine betaine/proline transport system permease protein